MAVFRPAGDSSEDDFSDCEFDLGTLNVKDNNKLPIKRVEQSSVEQYRQAAINGDIDKVKKLFEEGKVKVDETLQGDWTPTMHAASMGNAPVVKYLLGKGSNPNFSKDRFTTLMAAASGSKHMQEGLTECVNLLLQFGADAKACNRHRLTALMLACKEGYESIVHALLEHSDVNAQDNQGWTALYYAVCRGNENIVKSLLDWGALLNIIDRHGRRPLEIAITGNKESLITLLGGGEIPQTAENIGNCNVRSSFIEILEEARESNSTLKKEVVSILSDLGLQKFASQFKNHNIDLKNLLTITDRRLAELNMAPRYRTKLLEAIDVFHKTPWKKSSVHIIPPEEPFSVHSMVVTLCGILRQLDLMYSTAVYVRQKVKDSEDDFFSIEVKSMKHYAKQSQVYTELLYKVLNTLLQDVKRINETEKSIPADLIVKKKRKSIWSNKTSIICIGLFLSFALILRAR